MSTARKGAAPRRVNLAPLSPVPGANLRAKRALDLTLGLPIMVVAGALLLLIWVTYKLSGLVFQEDRGPVFRQVYRHTYGRVIPIYKIRISTVKALDGQSAKIANKEVDPLSRELRKDALRLGNRAQWRFIEDSSLDRTRFGHLIKAMYLDELPQILNIVKGDMSFVGPRPFGLRDRRTCPDHDGLVTLGGERFDYRHRDVLPGGLTGLYQTNKSAAAKTDPGTFVREGVALDRQYYEQLLRATPCQVIKTDLSIICRTIPVVLRHEGI